VTILNFALSVSLDSFTVIVPPFQGEWTSKLKGNGGARGWGGAE
jgi:hypothetical protein